MVQDLQQNVVKLKKSDNFYILQLIKLFGFHFIELVEVNTKL